MTRRALTFIEMLLSLSLLALVVVAAGGWLQITSRAAAEELPAIRWKQAANATLNLIADDLRVGDFSNDEDQARVLVDAPDRLIIQTRDGGPVSHTYELDAGTGELYLNFKRPGDPRRQRVLIADVQQWICTVQVNEETLARTLKIRIESTRGDLVKRSFR